jgi:DNA-binding Lrp family transcriptional regulator
MEIGFVLLNCDLGAEEYLLEEIKQIPEVKQAYLTFGAYDIIIEVHAKSADEFDKTVSNKIRRLSRVMSTMTLKVLSTAAKH